MSKKKSKLEEDETYYNNVYSNSASYKLKPQELVKYYYCWKKCADYIVNNNIKLVIDIGCGPGHFPEVINKINKNLDFKYLGIDFSQIAIQMCKDKFVNNNNYKFLNNDALKINYNKLVNGYKIEDVLFTSFEFMEHITFDLELLELLPKKYKFNWSVPSYKCIGHVRWFNSIEEIISRYEKHVDFENEIDISPFKKHTYYITSLII
jgi:SAM-dependent methyltransferase